MIALAAVSLGVPPARGAFDETAAAASALIIPGRPTSRPSQVAAAAGASVLICPRLRVKCRCCSCCSSHCSLLQFNVSLLLMLSPALSNVTLSAPSNSCIGDVADAVVQRATVSGTLALDGATCGWLYCCGEVALLAAAARNFCCLCLIFVEVVGELDGAIVVIVAESGGDDDGGEFLFLAGGLLGEPPTSAGLSLIVSCVSLVVSFDC